MTLSPACTLEEVDGVLSLGQEQAVGGARDGDVEEVLEALEISHGKLRVEASHDALEKLSRRGGVGIAWVDAAEEVEDDLRLASPKWGGRRHGANRPWSSHAGNSR